jgi:hypothetical protein
MSSEAAESWNLRDLVAEAERRGLALRIEELRKACREGVIEAAKRRGAWVVEVAEAARFLARQSLSSAAKSSPTAAISRNSEPFSVALASQSAPAFSGTCDTAKQLAFRAQTGAVARFAIERGDGFGEEESLDISVDVVDFDIAFEPCDEELEFTLDWSGFDEAAESVSDHFETELAAALGAVEALRQEAEVWTSQQGEERKAPAAVERRALKRRSLFRTVSQESPRDCDLAMKMRAFDRRRREVAAENAADSDLAERSFEALMHLAEEAGHCASAHARAEEEKLEGELEPDTVGPEGISEESKVAKGRVLAFRPEVDEEPPFEEEPDTTSSRVIEERDEEGRLLSRLEVVESPQVWGADEDEDFIAEGAYVAYHADGSEAARGFYVAGALEGSWRQWHPGGTPAVTGQHRRGRPEGDWVFFHANGVKAREGAFEGGAPVGIWRSWDRRGRLLAETGELAATP